MSNARVTEDGLDIEYTDSKSGITVLHRISEKEGEPIVEDYFKGKDGKLTRTAAEQEIADPAPAAAVEPAAAGDDETTRIFGFRFRRAKQ